MNKRQKLFVMEYTKDLNATQAAIRAGYSKRTARSVASEILTKPDINEAIAKAVEDRTKAVGIDAAYVLMRLKEINEMDVLDILNDDLSIRSLSEWPKVWRTMISGIDVNTIRQRSDDDTVEESILKKMKWPDKVKNLELIGKHVDVQAFNDRIDVKLKVTLEDIMADPDVKP